jgi:hypothetical protein
VFHLTGVPATDLLLLCAAVAACTMLIATIFNRIFDGWDERALVWFSRAASSPKWSVGWVLIFLAWLPIRELLIKQSHWFANDGDLIVLTVLWSVGPYMVENAMKYSTAKQMALLETQSAHLVKQNTAILDLTTAVRAALDRSEERDDLLHDMVGRLLDAIEQPESSHDKAL